EPWRNDLLTDKKYEELYYLTPEMKKEYELELKIYLSLILKDLIAEKDQEINAINQSIGNQKGIGSQSKWCKECNTTNIDNKKCTCPNCHKKLDTLATLQAESAEELARLNNTLHHMLCDMIGHTDNESSGGQSHSDYTLESQRFRIQLRKFGFLNPQSNDRTFRSLGEESLLSEQLKNFSDLVCERRRRFIDETFKKSKSNHLLRPIPVTAQEEAAAMDEANISKYRGLKQKNRSQLQEILQSIRDLYNEQDGLEDEVELENQMNL
ncbi:14416_t:CDS:2, partial [Cetraspora pellucida]